MYKAGDKIEFLHITWEDEWEFGSPSILLEPEFKEHEENEDIETILEELAERIADSQEEGKQYTFDSKKSDFKTRLKRIATNRIKGGAHWDKYECIVTKGVAEFYEEDEFLFLKIIKEEQY